MRRSEADSNQTTRDAILSAATRTFAQYGYEATKNKMIAEVAGVAPGLIYHYFDSKLSLFAESYRQITRYRYDRSKAVLDSEETLAEKIRALAQDLIDMWAEDPSYVEFHARTLSETQQVDALRESLRSARRETEVLWRKLVDDAKRRGEISSEPSTDTLADACISWFAGLVMLLSVRGAQRTLAATDMFVAGIEAAYTP